MEETLKRIFDCEIAGNRQGVVANYLDLGNMFIDGCPAVKAYCRRSLKGGAQHDFDIMAELAGMHLFAQYLIKPNTMIDTPLLGRDTFQNLLAETAGAVSRWDRDQAVKNYISLGRLAIAVILGGNVLVKRIEIKEIAEEIGLQIFIISQIHSAILPDPRADSSRCGKEDCPLKFFGLGWESIGGI